VTQNYVCLAGETRSLVVLSNAEVEAIVRGAIADIGYTDLDGRFCAAEVKIENRLHGQSAEIADAVDKAERRIQGAGDQGMMFGYATAETPELMPAPITWAHALTRGLAEMRKSGLVDWLRPDAKTQVSVRYIDGVPTAITGIIVSTQHHPDVTRDEIRAFVLDALIPDALTDALASGQLAQEWQRCVLVNPSGRFTEGGPATDTGLTGRKIIVDTYGGAARHGGGAFSGKDPSKVDRSAAYAARWAAKNVVAAGLAKRCEICVAYAIGVAEPVAIGVETFGTAIEDEAAIDAWIRARFDLTPHGIIEGLDLLRPIYEVTSAYGHFGRVPDGSRTFPWEAVSVPAAIPQFA
jgi:S-adenosylmethionine synthetase